MSDMAEAQEVRIALVMGGGVSLGSFSGGALAETLRLIEEFPAGRDGAPIVPKIDVVSGASAGSMTLAVMLRYLLAGEGAESISPAMADAWVQRVGLDYGNDRERQLLPDLEDFADPSLLSDYPVRVVADKHLGVRSDSTLAPHGLLGDTVYVSFSVANLHGIDVRAPWQWIRRLAPADASSRSEDDVLVTTFHDDRFRFRISPGRDEGSAINPTTNCIRLTGFHDQNWAKFREAAIASGAFPAAFPPVTIRRKKPEYGDKVWPEDLEEDKWFDFAFVDGGVFRNEPLREAIELAAIRDSEKPDPPFERVFLVIDPHISGSHKVRALGHEAPLTLKTSYDEDGSVEKYEVSRPNYADGLLSVLGRLTSVVSGQAKFRDWIRAGKLNRRIEWGSGLARLLVETVARVEKPTTLASKVSRELRQVYAEKAGHVSTSPPKLTKDRKDVSTEFEEVLGPLTTKHRSLARDLILLVRNVAGLRDKRHLNLVAITPWTGPCPPLALSGNFMANFGGFFKEAWRSHDFRVGEYAARYVLNADIRDPETGQTAKRLIQKLPASAVGRPPALREEAVYRNVESTVRKRFESVLHNHLEAIAAAGGVMDWVDDMVAKKIRASIVKSLFGPHGDTRYVVIQIRGSIETDFELVPAEGGESTRPTIHAGHRVLETVCALHYVPDESRNRYFVDGPHVHAQDGAPPEVRVIEDRTWPSPNRHRFTVQLRGSMAAWYSRAERDRFLQVHWDGTRRRIDMQPEDLEAFAPHTASPR